VFFPETKGLALEDVDRLFGDKGVVDAIMEQKELDDQYVETYASKVEV
jgi:hypothetical protein